MTISDILARCTCCAPNDSDTPDYREQPLRSLDGEPIKGFQEVRFGRLEHGDTVVARATVRSR